MLIPSWQSKCKKIGSPKKIVWNLGIQGKGYIYKNFEKKKILIYLLPASRDSKVMIFTQSWAS